MSPHLSVFLYFVLFSVTFITFNEKYTEKLPLSTQQESHHEAGSNETELILACSKLFSAAHLFQTWLAYTSACMYAYVCVYASAQMCSSV